MPDTIDVPANPALLLFEQASMATDKPQIDRAAGILRRVHLMGPVSKHGYSYALDAMKAVAQRFEGMAVGVDHDYRSGPLTDDHTWGNVRGPIEVDPKGLWGDLHFVKAHVRSEQLLESIERGLRDVALSPVVDVYEEKGKTVTKFSPRRIDVVIGGATTKSMFEQDTLTPEVQALQETVKGLQVEVADLKARSVKYEQYVDPRSKVAENVAAATADVDLKKHWND